MGNDIEMLSELNKYDNNALNKIDDNKSNIFHYAVSQKSIKCIKWILDNIKDKALIIKLLKSKDQYHWTPLSLSNYLNNNNEDDTTKEIYNLLKQFNDENDEEKKKKKDASPSMLPAQYKYNLYSRKRKLWIIINPFSGQAQ